MKQNKDLQVCVFDLETTNLTANPRVGVYYTYLLCMSYKVGDGPVKCIKLTDYKNFKKDPHNDYELCRDAQKILNSMDFLFGWYSYGFDQSFLNTRLIYHGLPIVDNSICHKDGWRIAKYHIKFDSNRLNTVAEFLTGDKKSPHASDWWVKAVTGKNIKEKAKYVNFISKYCDNDVLIAYKVYLKLRPLIKDHPKISRELKTCPVCGSKHVSSNGIRVTATRRYVRLGCKSCGYCYKGDLIK